MVVSNKNLLFQGSIFRCELLVLGRVTQQAAEVNLERLRHIWIIFCFNPLTLAEATISWLQKIAYLKFWISTVIEK